MKKRTKKPNGRFCVINDRAPGGGDRTILPTEQSAIDHAHYLMNQDYNQRRGSTTFYVVEIKAVITVGELPIKRMSARTVELS